MSAETSSGGAGRVQSLSFHANYRCRNTGVCCSSGWDIAVESSVEVRLRSELLRPGLALPNGPDGFRPMVSPPVGCSSSLRRAGGTCWFHDRSRHECSIHRAFGESALPSACRHFPRVCVLEPDRVAVSLSHYCPTAASLLFRNRDTFKIMDAPAAFPASWPFEGLDVREAWPPFLRPGVLLGFDGWRELERCVVGRLTAGPDVHSGLAAIEAALDTLAKWRADDSPITEFVRTSFARVESAGSPRRVSVNARDVLAQSLPDAPNAPDLPDGPPGRRSFSTYPPDIDLALRRYLAARTVANWIVYHADDIRILGRYLRLCLDTVDLFALYRADVAECDPVAWLEAVRSSDLWLMHHCDPERIARNLR